jgi:hypothetical protein
MYSRRGGVDSPGILLQPGKLSRVQWEGRGYISRKPPQALKTTRSTVESEVVNLQEYSSGQKLPGVQ